MFHWLLRKSARLFSGSFGRVGDLPIAPAPESGTAGCGGWDVPFLHWPSEGCGGPLVLVHGLLSNPWIWARLASLLRDKRAIWAPTLRGHGAVPSAPACRPDFSLDSTTGDLLAFLDFASLDKVALLGHSWGGKIAVHFAARHPERVTRLLLADPVLPAGFNRALRRFPGLATAGFAPERCSYPDRKAVEDAHAKIVYLFAWDDADRAFWTRKFSEQPDGSFVPSVPDVVYRQILDVTLQEDTTPLLPRIACPVLLMRPTFTVSFWPGELRPLRRALQGRLVERRISGDHTFVHSNPRDTAKEIEDFLQRA